MFSWFSVVVCVAWIFGRIKKKKIKCSCGLLGRAAFRVRRIYDVKALVWLINGELTINYSKF